MFDLSKLGPRHKVYPVIIIIFLALFVIPYQNCVSVQTKETKNEEAFEPNCVLRSGSVFCSGFNQFGQMGNGTIDSNMKTLNGVMVEFDSQIKELAANKRSTCALLDRGSVWCWGYSGRFGRYLSGGKKDEGSSIDCGPNGLNQCFPSPIKVSGLEDGVTTIAGHGDSFCAVKNREVYCWGEDFTIFEHPDAPAGQKLEQLTKVPELGGGVFQLAMGSKVSCVNFNNGSARCFKYEFYPYNATFHLVDPKTTTERGTGVALNLNQILDSAQTL